MPFSEEPHAGAIKPRDSLVLARRAGSHQAVQQSACPGQGAVLAGWRPPRQPLDARARRPAADGPRPDHPAWTWQAAMRDPSWTLSQAPDGCRSGRPMWPSGARYWSCWLIV